MRAEKLAFLPLLITKQLLDCVYQMQKCKPSLYGRPNEQASIIAVLADFIGNLTADSRINVWLIFIQSEKYAH